MNSLKIAIFMLTMGLSFSVVYADSIDRSTEPDHIDRNSDKTNSTNQTESIKMHDCSDKSGPAKVECLETITTESDGELPNHNSIINRNKNRQIRENIKSNQPNSSNTAPGS